MVKKIENVTIKPRDYKLKKENEGKVALFNFDTSMLVAEGDGESDWLELQLMCEDYRKNGNYKIVIVPHSKPSIKMFRKVME